ncbi:XRE family transcriptional regulator [Caballeronia sp. J97]|uniref:XRE family transcriptional regulator n=1 Tax=Caballeronia sp. J97 TaxID=2805429 RepID=UPI002AB1F5C5|nr:XRE family transcriptional regulator [Caballeronia sp. J97]
MNREQDLKNVAANLSHLANTFDSASEFCRKLDINRQQFNKYVAAQHLPAQKVIQKIARHFLIEPAQLLLAPAAFKRAFEERDPGLPFELQGAPELVKMFPAVGSSGEAMRGMLGVYHRYHNSSIYKGMVLRSVTWLYVRDGTARYVTIERFPLLDGSARSGYTFTYHGFCLALGDRLFLIDSESKQRNEVTLSILTQQPRRPIRFLYGIYSAVASSSYRQPFSTRLVLHHVSNTKLTRQHLRQATVLRPDDASIPPEIRNYLCRPGADTVWGGED